MLLEVSMMNDNPVSWETWYTVYDISVMLQVAPPTIRRWARSGELKGYKLGQREWRFADTDVRRFIRSYLPSRDAE